MVSKIDLGILAIAGLATFLIIRGGGEFLKGLKNPFEGLEFPSIGDITLPDFNIDFPDFSNLFGDVCLNPFGCDKDDSSSIAGETVPFGDDGTTVTIPEDTTVNPDGTVTSSTPPILNLDEISKQSALDALAANRLKTIAENEAFARENNIDLGTPQEGGLGISDSLSTIVKRFQGERGLIPEGIENLNIQSAIDDQQFTGGGTILS